MSLLLPVPVVLGKTPHTGCHPGHYMPVALPLQPSSINDSRQVAGTTAQHRAALWNERTGLRELPLPAGFYSSDAVALNNSGHVLLVVYDRTLSDHRAFIFAHDLLTALPGEATRGLHINDSDAVAGESLVTGKTTAEPVYWIDNTLRLLGGCCGGTAKGINKHGEIVGDAYDDKGRYSAFLWAENRGIQRIGPPDRFSSAISINDQGHAVVQVFSEAFLFQAGSLVRLDLSAQYPNHPQSMNNCDVIVGSYGPFRDAERAFVWEKSAGFHDLNSLIAAGSGWKLESAVGINDRGEIVGRGDYNGDEDHGFLLIPVP